MFSKGLGLKGPDTAMLQRAQAPLPRLSYSTLTYDYLDMFGPIEDQDVTGECWCYSTGALFEAYHFRRKGERVVISKRALASVTNARVSPGNTQDQGGYPSDAVTTLESGYVPQSAWPDDASDDTVQMNPVPADLVTTELEAGAVLSVDAAIAAVIQAGHAHGPVVLCVGWPQEWYTASPLGADGLLVPLSSPPSIVGYHAIVLRAANAAGGYAVIRNSWGTSWGGGVVEPGYAAARYSDLAAILTSGCCCEVVP